MKQQLLMAKASELIMITLLWEIHTGNLPEILIHLCFHI